MPVSFQMVVRLKELDPQNKSIRHLKKPATKEKIKKMARMQKQVAGIPQIHVPRRQLKKK